MESTIINKGFATEQQFQAACVKWFNNTMFAERGMLHCNNNNSHTRLAGNIARAMGVFPGVSDLELLMPMGRVAFIELKLFGGVLSTEQIKWRDNLLARQHLYFVIHSIKDSMSIEPFMNLVKMLLND